MRQSVPNAEIKEQFHTLKFHTGIPIYLKWTDVTGTENWKLVTGTGNQTNVTVTGNRIDIIGKGNTWQSLQTMIKKYVLVCKKLSYLGVLQ